MLPKIVTVCVLFITLLPQTTLHAAETSLEREIIYGWHLMSREERHQYKARLRHMKTDEERQAYRKQHRQKMQQRAQRLGIKLEPVEAFDMGEEEDPMSGRIRRE